MPPENDGDTMRFSDSQLVQLRQDFDEHKADNEARWERQEARWEEMLEMVGANTRATTSLAESTRGVVQLYADVQGTVRIGAAVQRFCGWALRWGSVGVVIATGVNWLAAWVVRHWGG